MVEGAGWLIVGLGAMAAAGFAARVARAMVVARRWRRKNRKAGQCR